MLRGGMIATSAKVCLTNLLNDMLLLSEAKKSDSTYQNDCELRTWISTKEGVLISEKILGQASDCPVELRQKQRVESAGQEPICYSSAPEKRDSW